ncbi:MULTISPECIES: hypothetical protein [Acinetobacter]|jgi:hypothetical protein|uniref:Uncharacterized protein n=3 Tax=Acinetobacter variabilis TaxID=70346 RepID=N8WL24_9GAMM|nr:MULTISPECIES: hypothetical protein [Acinetobacter]AUX91113.1 hypothetical protein C3F22_15785 [Acinetobacter sp. ACNIH1]ENU97568.1 hypothetical protein F969_03798 [Acinetobacter variabilis]MBO3661526.1 hypothetical protein [Acinetobacter variabilis]MCU4365341.1 hypothetical protein [Acinetobacter variabilis]MCU4375252.1 hypothetical protein [Acinetobacter variabilis]
MVSPDQNEMFDVLEKQRQHQRQVDRVLKIVLPIVAFLMAVICANMNIWSPLFTFAILWIAFYAVGIKRMPIWHWVVAIIIYCLIDNILSYGSFNLRGFNRQFGTMFIFLGVIGVGRPYFDRWLMKKEN